MRATTLAKTIKARGTSDAAVLAEDYRTLGWPEFQWNIGLFFMENVCELGLTVPQARDLRPVYAAAVLAECARLAVAN